MAVVQHSDYSTLRHLIHLMNTTREFIYRWSRCVAAYMSRDITTLDSGQAEAQLSLRFGQTTPLRCTHHGTASVKPAALLGSARRSLKRKTKRRTGRRRRRSRRDI